MVVVGRFVGCYNDAIFFSGGQKTCEMWFILSLEFDIIVNQPPKKNIILLFNDRKKIGEY